MDLHDWQDRQCEIFTAKRQAKTREMDRCVREDRYIQRIQRMERRRRAEICQNVEVVLFFASGSGVTFGLAAHYFALGVLRVVCAMAFAVVCAAVGFWCDRWSRS